MPTSSDELSNRADEAQNFQSHMILWDHRFFTPAICPHTCIYLMTEGMGLEGDIIHSKFIHSANTHQAPTVRQALCRGSTELGSFCPQGAHRLAGGGPAIAPKYKERAIEMQQAWRGETASAAWVAQRPGHSGTLDQAPWQVPCQVNSIISSQRAASLSQQFEWKGNKVACGSYNPYIFAQPYKKTLLLDGDRVSLTWEIMFLWITPYPTATIFHHI